MASALELLSLAWFTQQPAGQVIYKPGNQTFNSLTLANDSALVLPVQANAVYFFGMCFTFQGGTAGSSDFKWGWTFPSGTTMLYGRLCTPVSGSFNFYKTLQSDVVNSTSAGSGLISVLLAGSVTTSTTAGNLQFQWSQNSGTVTPTTVQAGSVIAAWMQPQ